MFSYSSKVINEFYDYDLDTLMARVDARAKESLSIDVLESFADKAHETANPAKKIPNTPHYSQDAGIKIVTIEYFIPTSVGHETALVSLSYDNGVCCKLIGFDLK